MRIVHLLNWDLESITEILDDIKRQGFDAIQINPMQPFKTGEEFHWYYSYQPLGFRIGNMFGTKESLEELCYLANKRNISIIVDVICNHVANNGDDSLENRLTPNSNIDEELKRKEYFKEKKNLENFDNRYCATHELIGLPGLNLKNEEVQSIIFRYLEELRLCGVKGFRFDAAKHMGLPNDGVSFFDKVSRYCNNYGLFGYGEFIGGNKEWQEEFLHYLPILTGYTNCIEDKDSVFTYFESHDTFLNDDAFSTYSIKTKDVINIGTLLNNKFMNTIFYVRPIYYPFNPRGEKLEGNHKTKDYFDLSFLTNDRIRQSNNIEKTLVKRIW